MKKILILLISILSLALMYSCEEDQVGPTLDLSKAVAPAISSPLNGTSIVLTMPEAETLLLIEWSAADYKMEDIPVVKYNLTMSYPAQNQEITLTSSTDLSTQISYQSLNFKLIDFGFVPDQQGEFVLKVTSSISDNTTTDDLVSESIVITLTSYDDTPPPPKPIYLLGSATLAGWSNTAALEMTWLEAGKFEITTTLASGSSMYLKFISVPGQWAPQWGTTAAGTWESGPLSYRPTEAIADPPAIPAPPTSGAYIILADTANLTYTVTAVPEKLYFVSISNNYEFDFQNALVFNKVSPYRYELTVEMIAGSSTPFAITTSLNANAPFYRAVEGTSDKMKYEFSNSLTNGFTLPAPSVDGLYQIDVDVRNMSYSIIKK